VRIFVITKGVSSGKSFGKQVFVVSSFRVHLSPKPAGCLRRWGSVRGIRDRTVFHFLDTHWTPRSQKTRRAERKGKGRPFGTGTKALLGQVGVHPQRMDEHLSSKTLGGGVPSSTGDLSPGWDYQRFRKLGRSQRNQLVGIIMGTQTQKKKSRKK